MKLPRLLLVGVFVISSGCSTTIGTTVVADRLLPPGASTEPIGLVSASIWVGHFLWAAPADRELYEAARQKVLALKGGTVLTNAKVTTTMTSYFLVFYQTEIAIEGTAAKLVLSPKPSAEEPRPEAKP